MVLLREKILPARWRRVGNGKRFSLLARNGQFSLFLGVPGEFCTGWALRWVLWGEFCTGWPCGGCCRESFVPVGVVVGWWCPCDGCWVVLLREKILPARWCGVGKAKKFALLGGAALETRKSSPCSGKMARFWCFWARWASFFARERLEGRAGRVFSRFGQGEAVAGRTFSRGNGWMGVLGELFRVGTVGGACWANFFVLWRYRATRSCVATAPTASN